MKKLALVALALLISCGVADAQHMRGSSWNEGDLKMQKSSIDGDQTDGLAFDPDSDGVDEITFEADGDIALTGYTIPRADGNNGEVLSTNGSGTLSWGAGGGGAFTSTTDGAYLDGDVTITGTMGVGTATVPHGAVGGGMLAIDGADGSANGPHIQITTATDDYPLIQLIAYQHDNVGQAYDAYWDGSWKSSDAGSNFAWYKVADKFQLWSNTGTAAGGAISPWNVAMVIDAAGNVGIGTASPSCELDIMGNVSISGYTSIVGNISTARINTGQGITEVHLMNQDVETSDAVTFATVDTGYGANELWDMDQNVQTSDDVVFASMDISNNLSVDDITVGTGGITGIGSGYWVVPLLKRLK